MMLFSRKALWGVAVVLGLASPATADDAAPELQKKCMACHAGRNRLVFDPKAGRSRSITIEIERFQKADHRNVKCLTCHASGFVTFPHRAKQTKTCMDCHPRAEKGADADKPYDFDRIKKEFEGTAHFTKHRHAKERCCGTAAGKPDVPGAPEHVTSSNADIQKRAGERFTCEHCHEPHYFEATRRIEHPLRIRENDNGPCLECHKDGAKGPLADPAEPGLLNAHHYLPYAERHLESTRCIDCHTSVTTTVAHDLPKGRKADQGCNTCHSIDSVLMTRLYRYAGEGAQALGFQNARLLQDTYVMGANRHRWTDLAAYLLMSFGFALVLLHGSARILARWRSHLARRGQAHPASAER